MAPESAEVCSVFAAALDRSFFLIMLGLVIATASVWPIAQTGGPLHPEISIFWVVVVGIFLLEGLSLPTEAMLQAAVRVREHVLIQLFNLALIPAAAVGAVRWLEGQALLEPGVRDGILALACVPTTTGMSVMLTQAAGGNDALAAFNAVLGNTIAIGISPYLLGRLCRVDAVDHSGLALSLVGKLVLPLAVGQALRPAT